jgi:hypothetical protein
MYYGQEEPLLPGLDSKLGIHPVAIAHLGCSGTTSSLYQLVAPEM